MEDSANRGHYYHNEAHASQLRQGLNIPTIVASASPGDYDRARGSLGEAHTTTMPFLYANKHGSISPDDSDRTAGEVYHKTHLRDTATQQRHLSPTILHNNNPKRAYRQRRKDPSCDACRERKVKCDATETTSCTECSSRNVRCQFTKDTNRRMSSIKQVQDLERQLQETRAQLEQIRASENFADQELYITLPPEPDVPEVGRSPRRMLKARPPHDLSTSRAQLSDVARGILKPPIAPAYPESTELRPPPLSSLPSREVAQNCLDLYFECIHRRFPVVHWPHFCKNLWSLYTSSPVPVVNRETLALSFAVLAMGAFHSPDHRTNTISGDLINISYSYLDFWIDSIGIAQGVACFLISMYMAETNSKSTSYIWSGSFIRLAQDRGLHVQGGHWSPIDGESRKRTWYSLYVWDRLIATELGRPMQIVDEDCDTEFPGLLEEEERLQDPFHPQKPTLLLASIHVARLLSPLARLCKSLCITAEAASKFEAHLATCMQYFPPQIRLGATGTLDPLVMAPLLYFQNTRILLHRHNMSPACSLEQRTTAIDKCMMAAVDTAHIVSRCYQSVAPPEQIEERLRASASFLTCTHLWRCMLFLAFRQQWSSFHVLLRFADVIGDDRPINISCGRHLSLFLDEYSSRYHHGRVQDLELDEGLVVLLSGDLQASTNSWVWGTAESGTLLSRRQKHSRSSLSTPDVSETRPAPDRTMSWDSRISDQELLQWGGWAKIHEAAKWLEDAHRNQLDGQPQHDSRALTVDSHRNIAHSASDPSTSTSRSRMTIASITDL